MSIDDEDRRREFNRQLDREREKFEERLRLQRLGEERESKALIRDLREGETERAFDRAGIPLPTGAPPAGSQVAADPALAARMRPYFRQM